MGLGNCVTVQKQKWARAMLALRARPRAGIVLQNAAEIRDACDPTDEVLVELLHVPPLVWVSLMAMSVTNLLHGAFDIDLADMTLISSLFGPVLGFILLERMAQHVKVVSRNCVGHSGLLRHEFPFPVGHSGLLRHEFRVGHSGLLRHEFPVGHSGLLRHEFPLCCVGHSGLLRHEFRGVGHSGLLRHEFHAALGDRAPDGYVLGAPEGQLARGREWEEDETGDRHPWAEMDGCIRDDSAWNALDPLDPHALEVQMQIVIFASCFYVGTIIMLSVLVKDHKGWGTLLVCVVMPLFSLVWEVPRSMLLYALVHRSSHPPRHWLQYACKSEDDPQPDAHGHGHAHAHAHGEKARDRERAIDALWRHFAATGAGGGKWATPPAAAADGQQPLPEVVELRERLLGVEAELRRQRAAAAPAPRLSPP
eukprot:gene22566-28503_t